MKPIKEIQVKEIQGELNRLYTQINKQVKELESEYSKLEKVLDKACELLEHFDTPTIRSKRTKKQWKEYLLNEIS